MGVLIRHSLFSRVFSLVIQIMVSPVECSLADLQRQVREALDEGASLIYFHVEQCRFAYMLAEDRDLYRDELRLLRFQLRDSRILEIRRGEDIIVGDRTLYSMLVSYRGIELPPYMLLRGQGWNDDMQWIPYLFTAATSRDATLEWINREVYYRA